MRITFLGNFGVSYSSENHHRLSLESLGHEVLCLQEGRTDGRTVLREAINSDLLIVIHTHGWSTPGMAISDVLMRLKGKTPTLTYHLDLWLGLQREKDLEQDNFYKTIDHFFTVDKLMADWFNDYTSVQGHYLPAGVYDRECYKAAPDEQMNDVIFVGSKGYHPEYKYRPQLIDWLHKTYGDRFKHYGGDGLGVKRGADLNKLYASSKVVIGDTLCLNYSYPYYWSDRIYETTGRGGFIIHPEIQGLETQFEYGKEIVTYKYGDFEQLKELIDFYLENDKPREMIRQRGYERTKKNHTYKHRWAHILQEIGL